MYTLVRSDDTPRTSRNFTLLLIPMSASGVEVSRVQAFGMRGSAQLCNVELKSVRIGSDLIVGGPDGWNKGWGTLLGPGLDIEKLEVAAMALGVASAALDRAEAYSRQRVQFRQAHHRIPVSRLFHGGCPHQAAGLPADAGRCH